METNLAVKETAQSLSWRKLKQEVLAREKLNVETAEILLLRISTPIKASGRLKGSDEEIFFIVSELAERLTGHRSEDVIRALEEHEKASPWFPAYADLMKYIQPMIDRRLRMARRGPRNVAWVPDHKYDYDGDRGLKKLAPMYVQEPDDPPEVRQRAVKKYREDDRPRMEKIAEKAEFERLPPDIRRRVESRNKPMAYEKNEMIESVRRLAEMERESGREDVAKVMLEGVS